MSPRAGLFTVLLSLLLVGGCAIPRWPVAGPMTSPFGLRWSGILPEVHRGIDIAVPTGTECARHGSPGACSSRERRGATAAWSGSSTEGRYSRSTRTSRKSASGRGMGSQPKPCWDSVGPPGMQPRPTSTSSFGAGGRSAIPSLCWVVDPSSPPGRFTCSAWRGCPPRAAGRLRRGHPRSRSRQP